MSCKTNSWHAYTRMNLCIHLWPIYIYSCVYMQWNYWVRFEYAIYIYKLYIYIIYTLVLAQRVWSHNQGSLQQDSFLLSLTVQSNPPQEGKSVDGLSHVISSQRMNIRAQKPPPTSHLCPAKLQP
jgi:hypothetical protein